MKKFLFSAALFLLILPSFPNNADAFYLWRYRTHATDCKSLTDGKATDLCYEDDSDDVYKCEPTAGDCDTSAEWRKINNDFTTIDTDYGTESVTSIWTIVGDWINTANPWADDEVANDLTLAGGVIGTTAITLVQSTTPMPTAEGVIEWDTDDNRLAVGDGASTQVFYSGAHTTDTNANTICTGTTTYLDGEGNCDDISLVYEAADTDITKKNETEVITGDWDFGGGGIEIENGTTPPACTVGQIYLDTDATSGQQLYACEGGTFVLQGDGGGSETNSLETVMTGVLDDEVAVGTSADTGTYKALPSCSNATTSKLLYNTTTNEFSCGTDQSGGGGTAFNEVLPLPIQSAKISGSFVTDGDATQGAQIDAGDGNWRLLFDATTDEGAVWQFKMPNNYSSSPILEIIYSMTAATANTVEFEGAIMCVSDGDSADVGTASFSTIAVGSATVPGTVGYPDKINITLTDDSCAADDAVWVYLSTDADDATNDDATGDREVISVSLSYTAS